MAAANAAGAAAGLRCSAVQHGPWPAGFWRDAAVTILAAKPVSGPAFGISATCRLAAAAARRSAGLSRAATRPAAAAAFRSLDPAAAATAAAVSAATKAGTPATAAAAGAHGWPTPDKAALAAAVAAADVEGQGRQQCIQLWRCVSVTMMQVRDRIVDSIYHSKRLSFWVLKHLKQLHRLCGRQQSPAVAKLQASEHFRNRPVPCTHLRSTSGATVLAPQWVTDLTRLAVPADMQYPNTADNLLSNYVFHLFKLMNLDASVTSSPGGSAAGLLLPPAADVGDPLKRSRSAVPCEGHAVHCPVSIHALHTS